MKLRTKRFFVVALLAVAAAALVIVSHPLSAGPATATNIILLIGDGMGFEQMRAGSYYIGTNLVFESWARQGEVTTRSANSPITDSAASGTAMATGHKVNNGVVSLAIPGDGSEYETVLEFLKRRGKLTGLVTTTAITHATPAVFAAHEDNRNNIAGIAADYLNVSRPNVLLGGGSGFSAAEAAAAGYTVVTNRTELQSLNTASETMVSGQFGNGHMPYELDGTGDLPHLSEMTQTALEVLQSGTNGFFLMVEGGRIDHACHANDIARCVREVQEFDNAVKAALTWAGNRSDTLIIVTADHETGGLAVQADNGPGNEPDVTWSSPGHTGTNVGIFAVGPGSEAVGGAIDNTDVYRIMMLSQPVPPAARAIENGNDGQVRTKWDARPSAVCRLESSGDMLGTNWLHVMTVTASTHVVTLIDTNLPAEPTRFYRLVASGP